MFHQLSVTFGILISASVTLPLIQIENGWRYITGFVFVPCVLQLLLQKYIPFTPRWLIANGRFEEAKVVFTRLYAAESYDEVTEEMDYIHKHHIIDENMANNWKRPLFIGIIMNMFQQWTGINVVIYGAQRALKEQEIDEDNVFVAIMILYFINFMSTLLCCIVMKMKWFNKKTLYYIGTSLMCLMLVFLGLINIEYKTDTFIMSQLSISQIPLYVVGFAISLGTFNWELVTEAFPFENRVRFASICIFVQWFCNGVLSMSVDSISDTYLDGKSGPLYFIFCGMIILCIIFIKRYIPKTTGKSLENAVTMYMN